MFSYIKDINFNATPLDHYNKKFKTGAIEPNCGQLNYGMLPSANEPHGKSHAIGAVSLFDGFDRNTVKNQWPILNAEIYVFLVLDRKALPGELLDCDAPDRRFPCAKRLLNASPRGKASYRRSFPSKQSLDHSSFTRLRFFAAMNL